MKNHMTLLARLERISPILALRTLFAWEAPVLEDESGITVAEPEDGARELRDAQDRALLGARTVGDDIQIVAHEALLEQPDHDLNLSLQALGFAKNPLRMSAEQFYDRVLCIDAAWCLLQRFKDVGAQDPQEVTTRMLQIAAEWNALRIDCFEGRTSTSKVARVEELRGLLAQPQWKTAGVEQVTLNEDPRGSALSLKFANRTWETEVPAVSMNWQVAQPIAQAKPKARDKNGVRGTGERSKATLLPRATKIRAEVLAVLQAVQITGSEVRIIERLSPKLYKAVNDVLTEMGGKWSTSRQVHVFEACPQEAIGAAITNGELLTAKDYEFFPTPDELVAELLLLAGVAPGMRVLEPQAGEGAIALAAAEVVGRANVVCHELMPRNVERLQALGFAIEQPQDFLQVPPQPVFDRVLLNPPFSGGKDIAHIEHAMRFVRPGGRLAAIASTTWQTADNAKSRAFARWVEEHALTVRQIERGAFKAAGTDVPTVLMVLQAPSNEACSASGSVEQTTSRCEPRASAVYDNMDELAAAFF